MDRITIGKVSSITSCNIETIRYYEKEGLLPHPGRTSGGHRVYAQAHIERIVFIRRCRELGFSMAEVRDLLTLEDKNIATCEKVKSIADKHLQDIASKISDLKRMQKTLKSLVEQCSGEEIPDCPILDALQA